MNDMYDKKCISCAFTLAETLAALTVGSMVLIVVLAFYNRAQTGAASVINKLESSRLPREVLQRIAEDLDRIVGSGHGAQIDIVNKFQDGYPVAKLEILRVINDDKDQPQTLEKVVWQSNIEPDSGLLALYRSHSGIALEDNLLDAQKEPWQRELFVPICAGLTFFRIEVYQDGNAPLDKWSGESLPAAVMVTLSFAQPYKTADGTFDVPEEGKLVRTVAIDRTRKPAFTIPSFDANQLPDVNQPADANQPADVNKPASGTTKPNEKSQEQSYVQPPPPPPG
jgi:hypothetical protein